LIKKELVVGLACLLGALALVGVVLAQVSGSFDLSWNLISGGGGTRQSANYQVQDSLGLVAVDSSTSANYKVDSGFWIAAQPGVLITPTAALLRPGQTQVFEASGGIGTYSWAGTGGVITPTTGALVTYTAGDQKGVFSVIVTSGEAQATADVTIADLHIQALGSTQVNVNDTVMFEITNPAENTAPFSWFSTNTDVGTILPVGGGTQGELTAKAVGVTEVYAQDHVGVESNHISVTVSSTVKIPRVSIEKRVMPTGRVQYGGELTYTLLISGTPDTQIVLYDRLQSTTFQRFVAQPAGVSHIGDIVIGGLSVTSTRRVTISFVVRVDIPSVAPQRTSVTNRGCVYPFGGTIEDCIWSNEVANPAFWPSNIYLPWVLRSYQ
jgi:hypothetical protein